MSGTEVAAVIGAAAVLVTSVATLVATIRGNQTGRAVHSMAEQIDRSVNGRPVDAATIGQQVQDLADAAEADAVLPLVRSIADTVWEIARAAGVDGNHRR